MANTHWQTQYDPTDGQPYGTLCDCTIGKDHDGAGRPMPGPGLDTSGPAPAAPTATSTEQFSRYLTAAYAALGRAAIRCDLNEVVAELDTAGTAVANARKAFRPLPEHTSDSDAVDLVVRLIQHIARDPAAVARQVADRLAGARA